MPSNAGTRVNKTKTGNDRNDAVAQSLVELIKPCPLCQSELAGHEFMLLATCVVPSAQERGDILLRFFEAIKGHNWAELRQFRSWLGKADDVEAYAVRCSSRFMIAVVKTHLELLQSDRLLYTEVLAVEEGDKLIEVFASSPWYSF